MRSGSIKPPALQVSAQSLPGLYVVCLELEPRKKPLRVYLSFTRTFVLKPRGSDFLFSVVEGSGYVGIYSMSSCPEILEQNSVKH